MNGYRAAMSMAKSMLEQGIITEKEYYNIEKIIAEKYGVILSNICLRNPLIYKEYRVNMLTEKGGDKHGKNNKKG